MKHRFEIVYTINTDAVAKEMSTFANIAFEQARSTLRDWCNNNEAMGDVRRSTLWDTLTISVDVVAACTHYDLQPLLKRMSNLASYSIYCSEVGVSSPKYYMFAGNKRVGVFQEGVVHNHVFEVQQVAMGGDGFYELLKCSVCDKLAQRKVKTECAIVD